jgi:hypothetical protein
MVVALDDVSWANPRKNWGATREGDLAVRGKGLIAWQRKFARAGLGARRVVGRR